jgi:hypothetical protein
MGNLLKDWWWSINYTGLGLYLAGLAFLGGVSLVTDRLAFDPQEAPVRIQDEGSPGQVVSRAPWSAPIQRADKALSQKDVHAAEWAWREAYGLALRSRGWEGLLAIGDARLRIGDLRGDDASEEADARKLYLAALFRARDQGSLDGVLRSTERFAGLGDYEMASHGIRIAGDVAARGRDPQALARVRAFAEQLAAHPKGPRGPASDPF